MKASSSGQDTEISVISKLQSETTADIDVSTSQKSSGDFVTGRKKKWISFYYRLRQKICAVYMLIIAFIWLLHTIPIIIFFSINVSVSKQYNILDFLLFFFGTNYSFLLMIFQVAMAL